MKLRFIKGNDSRTILIEGKIVYILSDKLHPIRFDLNNFEKEQQRMKNVLELDEQTKALLGKIATLQNEEEIRDDIVKDYEEAGWKRA
jgi:hypothetical protein